MDRILPSVDTSFNKNNHTTSRCTQKYTNKEYKDRFLPSMDTSFNKNKHSTSRFKHTQKTKKEKGIACCPVWTRPAKVFGIVLLLLINFFFCFCFCFCEKELQKFQNRFLPRMDATCKSFMQYSIENSTTTRRDWTSMVCQYAMSFQIPIVVL